MGPFKLGPGFHMYHKSELVAIIEIKTTRINVARQMDGAVKQLKDYFIKAKYGLPLVIALRDLDKIITSEFLEGIEPIPGDAVLNLNHNRTCKLIHLYKSPAPFLH